jgi:hypothetical protein
MPHWLIISMLKGKRRRPKRRCRRRPRGRWWWWRRHPMRAKALRMSGLGGSSPPRMVQGLSLLLLAHIFCWMIWSCKYLLGLCDLVCVELDMHIMHELIVCCKLYAWELDEWWLLVYIFVYVYILVYMCLYEWMNTDIYECLNDLE